MYDVMLWVAAAEPSTTVVDSDRRGAAGSNEAVAIGASGRGRRWRGVGDPGAACCRCHRPHRLLPSPPEPLRPGRARPRQLRLAAKLDRVPNPRRAATLAILGPLLRHIQRTIHQRRALFAGIAKKCPYLAVLNPPRCATVLALDSRRRNALLHTARLIDDQHRIRAAQGPHHLLANSVPRRFLIPSDTVRRTPLANPKSTYTLWRFPQRCGASMPNPADKQEP